MSWGGLLFSPSHNPHTSSICSPPLLKIEWVLAGQQQWFWLVYITRAACMLLAVAAGRQTPRTHMQALMAAAQKMFVGEGWAAIQPVPLASQLQHQYFLLVHVHKVCASAASTHTPSYTRVCKDGNSKKDVGRRGLTSSIFSPTLLKTELGFGWAAQAFLVGTLCARYLH